MTGHLSQSFRFPMPPVERAVFDKPGLLEEVCFPVHLLHVEADQNVPVTIARHVAATIPGCRATFYPGEGHISTVVNHFDEVILTLSGG